MGKHLRADFIFRSIVLVILGALLAGTASAQADRTLRRHAPADGKTLRIQPGGVLTLLPVRDGGKVRVAPAADPAAFFSCGLDSVLVYDGPTPDAPLRDVWNCKRADEIDAGFFNESGALTLVFAGAGRAPKSLELRPETAVRAKIRNLNFFDNCIGCDDELAFMHELDGASSVRWQVSPDGRTNWRPAPGGTSPNYSPPKLARKAYYRAVVYSAYQENPAYSNVVSVSARLRDSKNEEIRTHTGCSNCPSTMAAQAQNQTVCETECTEVGAKAIIVTTIEDDFNGGINPNLWSGTTGVSNQNCASPNNDDALWFGSDIARFAETQFLDTEGACSIEFNFKFGAEDLGTQPQGCDDAEDPQENVFFQYSIDGLSWTTLLTLDNGGQHDPANPGPYDDWQNVCFDMPDFDRIKFRWIQTNFTGLGRDHWALEDVAIDFQADPTYSWQGPNIINGQNSDTASVCPTATTTYTVTATAAGQSLTETVTVDVVPQAALGGTATGARTICPLDSSGVLQVVGFQGNVTTWQRSVGCTGTWTSIPNTQSPTFVDQALLTETTCYRARVQLGNCPGASDPVQITVGTVDPGEVVALMDTVCPGDPIDFELINHTGDVVGWGNQNSITNPGTSPTLNIPTAQPPAMCLTAWVKIPGCPDSTAIPSQEACTIVRTPPVPGTIIPVQTWLECNTDSVRNLIVLGYGPADINHWEVSLDGGTTWDTLVNDPFVTPTQLGYNSDTAIAEGVCYRLDVNLDPTPVCGFTEPPPPPFCVSQGPCSCIFERAAICRGFTGPVAQYTGPGCNPIVEWQSAILGNSGNCNDPFLTWQTVTNDPPGDPLLTLVDPVDTVLCVRAIFEDAVTMVRDTSAPEPLPFDELVIDGTPGTTGATTVNPPVVCGGGNAGQVSVFIAPGDPIGVVQWEYADESDPNNYIVVPTDAIFLPFQNLTEDRYFRVILEDTSTITRCRSVALDTVEVIPLTSAGRVADSTRYCLGDAPNFLSAAGYTGTIERWEYCETNCDCGQGPNPGWTTVPGSQGLQNFPVANFVLLDQNSANAYCFRTIIAPGGTCPQIPSETALIEYLDPPVGGMVDSSQFVCEGDVNGPVLRANGFVGTVDRWESATDCANGPWSALPNTDADSLQLPALNTTTCFRAIITNGACEVPSSQVTIDVLKQSVPGDVTITGPDSVCTGGDSQLKLGESTGFTRWDRSEDGGQTWAAVPAGQYSGDSLINTVALTTITCFRAVLQSGTCPEVYSDTLCIHVDSLSLGGTISPDTIVCINSSPGVLTASGYRGDIQRWEADPGCANAWTQVPLTTPTFTPGPLPQQSCYRIAVKNGLCPEVYSPAHAIQVGDSAVGGTPSPPNTICAGDNSGLLTLAGHENNVVRWESATDLNGPWTDEGSAGSASFTSGPLLTTTYFRAVVDRDPCPAVVSDPVEILIPAAAQPGSIAPLADFCEGTDPGDLELTGNGGPVVRWESIQDPDCQGTWQPINNTTTTLAPGAITDTTCYRAVVDGGVCPEIPTDSVRLNPVAPPDAGALNGSVDVCAPSVTTTFELVNFSGTIVEWLVSSDGLTYAPDPSITGATHNPGTITDNVWYRVVVDNAICPADTSAPASAILQDETIPGAVGPDTLVCEDTQVDLELTGNNGSVLRWQTAPAAGGPWTDVANTTTNFTTPPLTGPLWVRAEVQASTCPPDFSAPAELAIDDSTLGGNVAGGLDTCTSNFDPDLTLGAERGSILDWEISADDGASWTSLAQTANSIQPGTLNDTAWYRVRVKNGACPEVFSDTAIINLKPPTIAGGVISDTTVCEGSTSGQLELTAFRGDVLGWQSDDGSGWADLGNAGSATFTSGALTDTTRFRAVVQNLDCPTDTSVFATVFVDSVSVGGTLSGGLTFCGDSTTTTLELTGQRSDIIEWEFTTDSSNWVPIAFTQNEYNPGFLKQNTWYRVRVQNGVCPPTLSDTAKITLYETSIGGELTGDTIICQGFGSDDIDLINQRGDVLYWEASRDSGDTWLNQGKAGFTTFRSGRLTITTWFRAVVQNNPCPADTSTVAVVEVQTNNYPGPNGFLLSPGVVCPGRQAFLVAYNYIGTIDRWEYSTDGFQTFQTINQNTRFLLTPPITEPMSFRAVVKRACGETRTLVAQVFPRTPPSIDFATNANCDGTGFVLIRTNAAPPTQFHLSPAWGTQINNLFLDLPPGRYDATVTDRFGCSATKTVNLKPAAPPAPVITDVIDIREDEARILWNPVPGADVRYTIRYRKRGSRTWLYIENLTTNGYLFRGLDKDTEYEFNVRAQCGPNGLPSDWSSIGADWFRTELIEQECHFSELKPQPVPRNLYTGQTTPNSITVHWDYIYYAAGYVVSYGLTRQDPRVWPQVMTCNPDTFLQIQNLVPGMEYGVRVRVNCDNCTTANKASDRKSDWSEILIIRTTPGRQSAASDAGAGSLLTVYPNPNKGRFSASYAAPVAGEARMRLLDVTGKTVWSETFAVEAGQNALNAAPGSLPGGVYLLEVRQNGDALRAKVVIE